MTEITTINIDYLRNPAMPTVQFTKSYSRLTRFYRETKCSLLKSTHSTKNLKTKLRTFQCVYRVLQAKFEANSPGVSELRSDKQTDRD